MCIRDRGTAWLLALILAVKLHFVEELASNSERRSQLLTWAIILGGALLLTLGIFRLATQLPRTNDEQFGSLQSQLQGERDARESLDRQLVATRQELQEFQQRTRAAAPTPKVAPTGAKEFTNKTVRQLRALYEGRTALQAEAFMGDEKGKSIDVSGSVVMVHSGMAFLNTLENASDSVECRFADSWNAKLSTFRKGETMKVRGVIGPSQNGSQIYLESCEIID